MPRIFKHEELLLKEIRRRLPDSYVSLTTSRRISSTWVCRDRRHVDHSFSIYITPFPGHEHGFHVDVKRVAHALRKVDQELERIARSAKALPAPRALPARKTPALPDPTSLFGAPDHDQLSLPPSPPTARRQLPALAAGR